jgi:GAF domain-containing protein
MIDIIAGDQFLYLRARFVRVIAWATVFAAALTLPAAISTGLEQDQFIRGAATNILLIVLSGLSLFFLRRGRQELAELGIIVTFTLAALITITPFLLIATLALLSVAALGTTRVYVVVNILVLGRMLLDALSLAQGTNLESPALLSSSLFMFVSLALMSVVTRHFASAALPAIEVARRMASLLQTSADIEKLSAQLLDLREIFSQSVTLLKTRFRYDHIQVYLVTENEEVLLVAAASTAGRGLLNRGFRIPVGSRTPIDQVVLSNSSLLRNLPPSGVPQSDDLFPDTRTQLVLPLRDGERVVGTLDIQIEDANAFSPADVQALQAVADLLATAVRNVRLYESQAQVEQENKRLAEQGEFRLREIERLNQELTRTSWQDYMKALQQTPGVTLAEDNLMPDAGWTDTLLQAQQERRSVSRLDGEQPVVAVPITLRGEVIGAIEVEPGGQSSGLDAVEMVEAVAQRLAISLENARLYEETQKTAAQEQRINDIAARYQQVTTVDELLRVTLQELSDTLGAQRGTIRLGKIQEVST